MPPWPRRDSVTLMTAVRLKQHLPLLLLILSAAACALPGAIPTPTPTTAPTPVEAGRLVVTWVESGNLMIWRSGEEFPRRIASGAVVRPVLSPDGAYIAFTRGPQGSTLALWAADAEGIAERELIGPDALAVDVDTAQYTRQIGQIGWLDDHTVLFNTVLVPQLPGPGGGKADDLWRADVLTGEATRLLPDGQGGDFTISPDGSLIALTTPGIYGAEQGRIRLTDAQGQAMTDLLRFDAVSTASEYAFYPGMHWLPDSQALLTAIPDPDLVYPAAQGQPPRTVALWRLNVEGSATPIGDVPATFFGLPRWSPDGTWMTYLEQVGDPATNTLGLVLARGDGSQPARLLTGTAGSLEPPQWSAAGFTYTFGAPGDLWLGRPGAAPVRFPADGESAFALTWADPTTAVYATAPTAPYELRLADLNNPIPAVITSVGSGTPTFDARRTP